MLLGVSGFALKLNPKMNVSSGQLGLIGAGTDLPQRVDQHSRIGRSTGSRQELPTADSCYVRSARMATGFGRFRLSHRQEQRHARLRSRGEGKLPHIRTFNRLIRVTTKLIASVQTTVVQQLLRLSVNCY